MNVSSFRILTPLIFGGLLASLTISCSDNNFAGAAATKKQEAGKKPLKQGQTSDDEDSLDGEGVKKPDGIDNGTTDEIGSTASPSPSPVIETTDGCADGSKVEDPNATFAFNGAHEMTALVNEQGKYTNIPTTAWNAGAVHYDQASADTVCKIKGYIRAETMARGRYSSCHDNTLGWWDESQKNFIIHNACKENARLDRATCRGKLKPVCGSDLSWIFKK